MAGTTPGAVPTSVPATHQQGRTLIHTPSSSRTRVVHGAWALGTTVAAVYSSRREASNHGVAFVLSDGAQQLVGNMPAGTARAVAAALNAAAVALETKGGVA